MNVLKKMATIVVATLLFSACADNNLTPTQAAKSPDVTPPKDTTRVLPPPPTPIKHPLEGFVYEGELIHVRSCSMTWVKITNAKDAGKPWTFGTTEFAETNVVCIQNLEGICSPEFLKDFYEKSRPYWGVPYEKKDRLKVYFTVNTTTNDCFVCTSNGGDNTIGFDFLLPTCVRSFSFNKSGQ